MGLVDFLDPSVCSPDADDLTEGGRTAEASFERGQLVDGEDWRQLVEDAVVGAVSLSFRFGVDDFLLFQHFAEGLDLLLQTVFGHEDGEVEC